MKPPTTAYLQSARVDISANVAGRVIERRVS